MIITIIQKWLQWHWTSTNWQSEYKEALKFTLITEPRYC
jgi:hypothetical protein